MTIKTFAAVAGTLAIIVVLFFITKVTDPKPFPGEGGFFRRNYRRLGRRNRRHWFLGISGRPPPRAHASVSNLARR